jgi:HAD superfamily hydrolase (TIGR01509 family)
VTAVVFDLDGVLVESEPLWQQGFADVVNAYTAAQGQGDPGLRADDLHRFTGGRVNDTVRTLLTALGHEAPAELVAALSDRVINQVSLAFPEQDAVIDDSVDVARRLAAGGTRLAIASSSSQRFIDAVVRRLGMEDAFEVTQSAFELERGKPDPEVYLLTCARLGVDPADTLAVEDSVPGLLAALRAGMTAVWLRPEASTGLSVAAALGPAVTEDEPLHEYAERVPLVTPRLRYEDVRRLVAGAVA